VNVSITGVRFISWHMADRMVEGGDEVVVIDDFSSGSDSKSA
jgi:nucleoside-diphosphate-sugar epimerase